MATTATRPPAPPVPDATPAPRQALVVAAALTTVGLWASAFVGIRAAGHDLSAGALTLARLLGGSAARGVGVLGVGRREPLLPPRADRPRLVDSSHTLISYAVFCLRDESVTG